MTTESTANEAQNQRDDAKRESHVQRVSAKPRPDAPTPLLERAEKTSFGNGLG